MHQPVLEGGVLGPRGSKETGAENGGGGGRAGRERGGRGSRGYRSDRCSVKGTAAQRRALWRLRELGDWNSERKRLAAQAARAPTVASERRSDVL